MDIKRLCQLSGIDTNTPAIQEFIAESKTGLKPPGAQFHVDGSWYKIKDIHGTSTAFRWDGDEWLKSSKTPKELTDPKSKTKGPAAVQQTKGVPEPLDDDENF